MEHFYEVLWTIIGSAGVALTTWLVATITSYIRKKVKDNKLASILCSITTLVMQIVQKTYQTVVADLKEAGKFDKDTQRIVKNNAINEIKNQLTVEQKDYIANLGVELEEWLGQQIESTIYALKK